MEFGQNEYNQISDYCKGRIGWFVSVWDLPSLKFLVQFDDCAFIKIPSAKITDYQLLWNTLGKKKQIILSTGMSDPGMIAKAIDRVEPYGPFVLRARNIIGKKLYCLMHSTSTYPTKTEELNLKCIQTLKDLYPGIKIGFSNHHPGIVGMVIAATLGAEMIELHITLDRSMWGTDHAASIEPEGVHRLMKYLKTVEQSMGDGIKRIYDSELPIMAKLRGTNYRNHIGTSCMND